MVFSSAQADYLRTDNASKLAEVLFSQVCSVDPIGDTPDEHLWALSLNLHMLQKSFSCKLLFKIYYSNR